MTETFLFKELTSKPSEALEFLDVWFKEVDPTSLVSIVRIHPTSGEHNSLVFTLEQIRGAIESSGLEPLIWDNNTIYDLYYGVSTLSSKPPPKKRGGLKDVKEVPGVWVDLDVKDGSFEDQESALDLLRNGPLSPTAVVLTGLGGVHGYWRLDKPVDCDTGRKLALRWWALMSDLAAPASIDKLCDPSRVLRVPGAIRWPKKTEEKLSSSSLLFHQDVSYAHDEIMAWTEDVWAEHQARIERTKHKVFLARTAAQKLVADSENTASNQWMFYMELAGVEDMFNEKYDWSSILEPQGWTKLGSDDEGRVLWSRPGDGVRKSATTDWDDSPHMMSLFSTAPETGLAELHDAGVALTKYRVWVELVWGGDEKSAISSLLH